MRITMYMLTKGSKLDTSSLRESAGFTAVPSDPLDGMATALFVKAPPPNEVKWASQLNAVVSAGATLPHLGTQSSGGVLLVDHAGAKYAITFGGGFQALNPSRIVSGFGLRVAANSIAQQKIKSADTKMLSSAGRSQKTMLPEASELTALGIEPLEEWVRQLSGQVADASFASTAAGADSLRLSIKDFTLSSLKSKLNQIAQLHAADTYKKAFGFIDNFEQLDSKKDSAKVEQLDDKLTELVNSKDSGVFFAAPDPFDIPDVHSYSIVRRKKIPVSDLIQDEVFDALSQLKTDSQVLTKVTVRALDGEDEAISRTYNLRECVQAEIPDGDDRYVLSNGRWFKVNQDYIAQVDAALKDVEDVTDQLALPAWKRKADGKYETEGDYNERVADECAYALLDKNNLSFGGYQKIEVCDLLTKARQLICVKRATRSSTLSHLFAQGSVSASLMYHADYKAKLSSGLADAGAASSAFGDLADWTVVYAIGTEKAGDLLKNMFFFSRMNLVQHVQDIRSRGIRVVIARIVMS